LHRGSCIHLIATM